MCNNVQFKKILCVFHSVNNCIFINFCVSLSVNTLRGYKKKKQRQAGNAAEGNTSEWADLRAL